MTETAGTTTLEPTDDRLLVEPLQEDLVRPSGLILPDSARERPHRGRIIALGPKVNSDVKRFRQPGHEDVQLDPSDVMLQIGDEVLYSKYGGTELKIDLREVVLLREADVFCRVREAKVEAEIPSAREHYGELDEDNLAAAIEGREGGLRLRVARNLEFEGRRLLTLPEFSHLELYVNSADDDDVWFIMSPVEEDALAST